MIEDVSTGVVGHEGLSSLEVNSQINCVTNSQRAFFERGEEEREVKREKRKEKEKEKKKPASRAPE